MSLKVQALGSMFLLGFRAWGVYLLKFEGLESLLLREFWFGEGLVLGSTLLCPFSGLGSTLLREFRRFRSIILYRLRAFWSVHPKP